MTVEHAVLVLDILKITCHNDRQNDKVVARQMIRQLQLSFEYTIITIM